MARRRQRRSSNRERANTNTLAFEEAKIQRDERRIMKADTARRRTERIGPRTQREGVVNSRHAENIVAVQPISLPRPAERWAAAGEPAAAVPSRIGNRMQQF